MKIIRTLAEMNQLATQAGKPLGLVPTMGALHEGHATLMRRARSESATVVVSIYVNPTQFGPNEDFSRYPRTLERDAELCDREGVDFVFAPSDTEMYAGSQASVWVEETAVAKRLEGERRPGHFRGVCTVVSKLFNIIRPDRAYFGQKDFQQLKVIERMVRDLCYPITIVPVETVREADGLAMSSRNRYLSAEERRQATVLWQALQDAQRQFVTGERRATILQSVLMSTLQQVPAARVDYAELADANTLETVSTVKMGDVALLAVFLGKTRLIDNHMFANSA